MCLPAGLMAVSSTSYCRMHVGLVEINIGRLIGVLLQMTSVDCM